MNHALKRKLRQSTKSYKPQLEALEDRCLLSGSVIVSPASREFTWGSTPTGPNPTYDPQSGDPCGDAAANLCDVTLLHVDVAPSYWGGKIGGVVVQVSDFVPSGPEIPDNGDKQGDHLGDTEPANFDFYIYASDANGKRGDLVASANHFRDAAESTAVLRASGYFLVQVVYTGVAVPNPDPNAPAQIFTAKATFVPPSEWTPVIGARALGLVCNEPTALPLEKENCRDFVGQIISFDGLTLSTRLRLPEVQTVPAVTVPLPTLLLLGGIPGNRSAEDPKFGLFDPAHLRDQGYAVLGISPRGVAGSCGLAPTANANVEVPRGPGGDPTCSTAWTHIADRNWEVRDYQHALGTLVDYGVAKPDQLVTVGSSWGAGQTWTLATALPWDSTTSKPWDTSSHVGTKLQLAAAVPVHGWTDFQNAFMPNGRATDGVDQSASHERPYGIPRAAWAAGTMAFYVGPQSGGRLNLLNAGELHSYIPGWAALWAAGESYDTAGPNPALDFTAADLAATFRGKSAYHADDYFAALRKGTAKPVPVFAISAWGDSSLPPVETLQMYRKLKGIKRDYPMYMIFNGANHDVTANSDDVKNEIVSQADKFLDEFAKGIGSGPDSNVYSFRRGCGIAIHQDGANSTVMRGATSISASEVVAGSDWDSIRGGAVRLKGSGSRTTTWLPPDPLQTAQTRDFGVVGGSALGCVTEANGTHDHEGGWTWAVPGGDFTLLGLPTVKLHYALTGADAQVFARSGMSTRTGREP